MSRTLKTWISVVGLCLAAQVAQAEPLKFSEVGGDARWVAHVDFDAIRASTVVKRAYLKIKLKHPNLESHLAMVKGFIGMNPLMDVQGMTFYGPGYGKHQGVMIVHAKFSKSHLERFIPFLKDHGIQKSGDGTEIHTWTHQHRHGPKRTPAAALIESHTLIVGSDVETVKKGLEVLKGKAAGIKDGSPLAGNIPQGTTVLARLAGVHDIPLKHPHPLLKQTESFRFVVGENEGESFFRMRSVMTNPQIVEQVKTVLNGGRALAVIHAGDDPARKQIAEAIKIKSEDKTVTFLWSAPADRVWAQIELHAKRIAEHMAHHHQFWHYPGHGPGPGHSRPAGRPGQKPQQKPSVEDF